MSWSQFFFADQHWHSLLGWHVALVVAFVVGWHLSIKWHGFKK